MNVFPPLLLSTAYLPNIQYFSKLLSYPNVQIETHDKYQKQSYRNRATILGANGKQDLVIPVKRPQGNNTYTRDVLIDYDTPWQKIHWKALTSAYKHSPFFEIFEAEMAPLYIINEKFLLDLNFKILDSLLTMTGTQINYSQTKEYSLAHDSTPMDFRETIHPKKRMQKPDSLYKPKPYYQVFNNKFGFTENLSFIDLLFNEGPQAIYLCKTFCLKPKSHGGH